jgi:cyclic pyranopterin phosphate synthase
MTRASKGGKAPAPRLGAAKQDAVTKPGATKPGAAKRDGAKPKAVQLSHVDPRSGQARMVDVGAKPQTMREAVARGRLVRAGALKKGDPLQVARLAGIMAAKQTATLIPLCHPLPLSSIDVELTMRRDGFEITARVGTTGQTGVEMEALTAVAVAGLTIYDMVKAADKAMTLTDIQLVSKRGGASGDYVRGRARGGRMSR